MRAGALGALVLVGLVGTGLGPVLVPIAGARVAHGARGHDSGLAALYGHLRLHSSGDVVVLYHNCRQKAIRCRLQTSIDGRIN